MLNPGDRFGGYTVVQLMAKAVAGEMSKSARNNLLAWLSRETSNGRKAKGCFVGGRLVVEGEAVPKDMAMRRRIEQLKRELGDAKTHGSRSREGK